MYDLGDILLFALSARRQVSWQVFKRCFDEIRRIAASRESDGTSGGADSNRWHVLRGLSSLGHIDLHFGDTGIQIVVGPPTLALLPTLRSHRAILCGARSPRTIKSLVQSAIDADAEPIVSSQVCTSDFATSRFEIRADNLDSIRAIAENAGIVLMEMPPARTIAHGSTSLFDYERNLMWSTEPEVDWYREDFDSGKWRFTRTIENTPRYRLSRYRHPNTMAWHHRLWQDDKSAKVNLDWGRYSILNHSTLTNIHYLRSHAKAFVPAGAPLPILLARAFAMCSGRWPIVVDSPSINFTGRCYEFSGVPPSVFATVLGKLSTKNKIKRGSTWTS